jgi:methanogenic corrinoid protein MtbC1
MTVSFNTTWASGMGEASGGPDLLRDNPYAAFGAGADTRDRPGTGVSGSAIAKLLEREIIPQLMLSHRPAGDPVIRGRAAPRLALENLDEFARLVLARDAAEIIRVLDTLLADGVELSRIYLDLLAPAARRIGEMWNDDAVSFFEVTVGLARLQQVLHEITRRNNESTGRWRPRRRIYLVPAPGEEHTFGLSMIEKFFLHAGWQTTMDHAAAETTIVDTVSSSYFEVLALSVATARFFTPLRRLIKRVRSHSLNRDIVVLVGGLFVKENPEIGGALEGAISVLNGEAAVEIAENLVVNPFQCAPLEQ